MNLAVSSRHLSIVLASMIDYFSLGACHGRFVELARPMFMGKILQLLATSPFQDALAAAFACDVSVHALSLKFAWTLVLLSISYSLSRTLTNYRFISSLPYLYSHISYSRAVFAFSVIGWVSVS